MAFQKKENKVEVIEKEAPNLLDQALNATRPVPSREEELVSLGFKILKAGVEKIIRVNRDWIVYGEDEAWIVIMNTKEKTYMEVVILDEMQSLCGEEPGSGCGGGSRFARFITMGRVAVK